MKRIMMCFASLFAICGGVAAQQITADDVEALPGETVSFTMYLDTEGGEYTALEFDIQFPQTGFTTGNAGCFLKWPFETVRYE